MRVKKDWLYYYKTYGTDLKIILTATILIVSFILAGKSMVDHDDFWYPFKNTVTSFQTIFSFTDKGKAAVHLKNTQDLYKDFIRIRQKNPTDTRLLIIAREMGLEEALAMKHMDLAKKKGVNIKDQVETLCETLEKQQAQLRFIVVIAKPEIKQGLQEALNITDLDLQKAMDW